MRKRVIGLLLRILLSQVKERDRESMISDLEEMHLNMIEKNGDANGDIWFGTQLLKSILPSFANKILWNFTMLNNYLKIAFRNIVKQKVNSIVNIVGFTISFTAFILIMLYVFYESSFDKFHQNSKNIYRLQYNYFQEGELKTQTAHSVPAIGPALNDNFSEVLDYVRISKVFLENSSIILKDKSAFRAEQIFYATPSIFDLFSFKLIKGDPETALEDPLKGVITESTAKKYFGSEDPLGKIVTWSGLYGKNDIVISGVCKDIPDNSHLKFEILLSYNSLENNTPWQNVGNDSKTSWTWSYYYTYILLEPNTNQADLQEKITTWLEETRGSTWEKNNSRQEFLLQPLEKI